MNAKHAFPAGSVRSIDQPLHFYRMLLLVGGTVYLLWWVAVEWLLPGSYNPLGSRLAVVGYCYTMLVLSFVSLTIARNINRAFISCLWLATVHYFYLFLLNRADINWVVGSYITVIAAGACLQTGSEFLAYATFVLLLSAILVFYDHLLLNTIFVPGILTILTFGYVGLRSRLRLLDWSMETSRRFQNLFDAVFEGVVVHQEGMVIDANESFAAIFGYRREQLSGKHLTDFVPPELRPQLMAQLSSDAESPFEIAGIRGDGTYIQLEIRGKGHTLRGRSMRLAAVRDVTARNKMEQDRILFQASQRAIEIRDEFLSIASHELKTPLTTIKIQTQMALRGFKRGDWSILEPARARSLFEQTDRQADRLTRLIEEMLDVTRVSSGGMGIRPEPFDLTQLLREVVTNFESSSRSPQNLLQLDLPPGLVIYADRFRMEQVISNLLSNALKYGDTKPVQIRAEATADEVRIEVEDQGIGIAPEDHQRIFSRFERAVSSNKISGFGLGLYIAKQIMDAHRGRIELISALGEGARFIVVLPVQTVLEVNV